MNPKTKTQVPPKKEKELQVMRLFGVARAPGGKYVAVCCDIQGQEVLSQDVLGQPEARAVAVNRAGLEMAKHAQLAAGKAEA